MQKDKIPARLRDLVNQYNIPTQETTPRFKSLLQDVLVDNPREMNLLIAGLEEDIPSRLNEKKGMVPFEMISQQLANNLVNMRGINENVAEWVVLTWAEAIGFPLEVQRENPTVQNPITQSSNQQKADYQSKYGGDKKSSVIIPGGDVYKQQPANRSNDIILLGMLWFCYGIINLLIIFGISSSISWIINPILSLFFIPCSISLACLSFQKRSGVWYVNMVMALISTFLVLVSVYYNIPVINYYGLSFFDIFDFLSSIYLIIPIFIIIVLIQPQIKAWYGKT